VQLVFERLAGREADQLAAVSSHPDQALDCERPMILGGHNVAVRDVVLA
jgi:hypothetical protein